MSALRREAERAREAADAEASRFRSLCWRDGIADEDQCRAEGKAAVERARAGGFSDRDALARIEADAVMHACLDQYNETDHPPLGQHAEALLCWHFYRGREDGILRAAGILDAALAPLR